MNQNFDSLLQDEAILNVMPILSMKMTVLHEILFRPLVHLSKPMDDVLILYLYQNLSIQWSEFFMTAAWAPRGPLNSHPSRRAFGLAYPVIGHTLLDDGITVSLLRNPVMMMKKVK